MLKNSLIIILMLTSGILGQSIQELAEQAGVMPTATSGVKVPTEAPSGPALIQSELPAQEIVKILPTSNDSIDIDYYGYSYFTNKNQLTFLNNLPAPANYQVGPGDEIIITIWGETQLREKGTISRDGSIYFENVGLVSLVNLSFEQTKKVLKSRFENVFSTLRGGSSATTFMETSLGTLKSINIHFLGEVNAPGFMPVHPFSSVTTGLMQAGGISLIGSLRDIQIIRNGKMLRSIDYYKYLQEGSITNNIRLIDNDVISVPVRQSTIKIEGSVRRPGIFELKKGETLADLLRFAGGLAYNAGSRVEIRRILPFEYRKSSSDDIQHIWVDMEQENDIKLLDGDQVKVLPIFVTDQLVQIDGQVKNPGKFSLSPKMMVTDLLDLAGGVFSPDHWETVYPFRADLIRTNRNESTTTLIPIQLDKLRAGEEEHNLLLQADDKIIIYPTEINKYAKRVEIFGDIRNPGEYFLDENMGLTDLILRSGGFSYSAFHGEVAINSINLTAGRGESLSQEVKLKVDPTLFNEYAALDDHKLKNRDQVFVRKNPEFQMLRNIIIEGEVQYPGTYALEKRDENLASIIERAGSLTDQSFLEGLRVLRNEKRLILERTGRGKIDLNLPVRPGDQIFIPKHTHTVEIIGEINSPGLVQYRKGLSVKDYIKIAGNYTLAGDKETVAVYYANGESKSRFLTFDPEVREGSKIVVYKKPDELPLDKTVFFTEFTTIVIQSLSLLVVANKLAN